METGPGHCGELAADLLSEFDWGRELFQLSHPGRCLASIVETHDDCLLKVLHDLSRLPGQNPRRMASLYVLVLGTFHAPGAIYVLDVDNLQGDVALGHPDRDDLTAPSLRLGDKRATLAGQSGDRGLLACLSRQQEHSASENVAINSSARCSIPISTPFPDRR